MNYYFQQQIQTQMLVKPQAADSRYKLTQQEIYINNTNSKKLENIELVSSKETKLLQLELKKKDQLIKYLQRKCGQEIIKIKQKMGKKIQDLERKNLEMQTKASAIQQSQQDQSKYYQLDDVQLMLRFECNCSQKPELETLQSLNPSELLEIILSQYKEIQVLMNKLKIHQDKVILSPKDFKVMRKAMSEKNQLSESIQQIQDFPNFTRNNKINTEIATKQLEKIVYRKQQTDEEDLNSTKTQSKVNFNLEVENKELKQQVQILKNKVMQLQKLHKITKDEQSQTQFPNIISQTEQIQTQKTGQELTKNEKEIEMLSKQLEDSKEQINLLKQQILFFNSEIQGCYDTIKSVKLSSNCSHQEEKDSPAANNIEIKYRQILKIFGIQKNTDVQKMHQKLLKQVNNMKKRLSVLLMQFRKMQEETQKLIAENEQIQIRIEMQINEKNDLKNYLKQLCIQMDLVNEELMKTKLLQFSSRLSKTMMNQSTQNDMEIILEEQPAKKCQNFQSEIDIKQQKPEYETQTQQYCKIRSQQYIKKNQQIQNQQVGSRELEPQKQVPVFQNKLLKNNMCRQPIKRGSSVPLSVVKSQKKFIKK